jgi:glycosyltransferase involved in cell wall biosynthesis
VRILMISPHPTYSPRGTPISVLNRCRALCALGHEIDLVTYGIGTDVEVAGLRWLRAPVPGLRTVKVGPSISKLPLDLAVFVKALIRAIAGRRRYDVIHSHEEAGIVGAVIARLLRLPHVYDMGNDLSVVMRNYGFSGRNPLTIAAVGVETMTVRWSDSVIAHFPAIAMRVAGIAHGRIPATVAENVPIEGTADPAEVARLRAEWSADGQPVALYTGTLEAYQGLPPLLDAMNILADAGTQLRLVIVGGSIDQQQGLRGRVAQLELDQRVQVVGAVAMHRIPSYLQAADVLVSPRAGGSNTPLKLFSYMHSRRPILATRIPGHLQVLDDDCATLVEPNAAAIADGLASMLADPESATVRAERACELAANRYGLDAYVRAVAQAYRPVGGPEPSPWDIRRASGVIQRDLVRAAG